MKIFGVIARQRRSYHGTRSLAKAAGDKLFGSYSSKSIAKWNRNATLARVVNKEDPMNTWLLAECIGYEQPRAVPIDQVVARVTAGEVIVLRGCLQELGYFATFQSIIRNVFEAFIGADKADAVMAEGVQWLHLYVSSKQLTEITKRLQTDLGTVSMMMVKQVARDLLGVREDAYAEESRNIRIFVPQDSWAIGRDDYLQFERERNRGKLTLHGPHTDVWGYHPLNVINVWTAIGPVLPGNGMSIWPELFGRIPPMGEWHVSRTDQVLGTPFGVSLNAGDALLFHIGHIHGSRINQTDQTRFVCSARFTVGPPILFDKPWYSYMNIDDIPDRIGTAAAPCATDPERPAVPPANIDTANRLPEPVASRPGEIPGTLVFESRSLGIGEVRPLTADYCVARSQDGVFAFSRHCPHEGGDLAAGYIRGDQVYCPGHNLGIDLHTGQSPCRSLPAIHILSPAESDNTVRVAGLPSAAASR
jgi:nitrite reductase/ring-hydroxylating ferredoxin subunit